MSLAVTAIHWLACFGGCFISAVYDAQEQAGGSEEPVGWVRLLVLRRVGDLRSKKLRS